MFVDANIFINWMTARRSMSMDDALCGYILKRIMDGETAVTSTLVKDEVLIWLSRYKASALNKFIKAIRMMPTLIIEEPTLEDEEFAIMNLGRYNLGISDLINLGIIKRLRLEGIYTLDKGFLSTGIKVVFYELKEEDGFKAFIEDLRKRGYLVK